MNPSDTQQADSLAAVARLAGEIRRLGNLVISRPLPEPETQAIADAVAELGDRLSGIDPVPKFDRFGGRNRVHEFLETGRWPAPPPDGSQMDFDIASVVGGEMNPFSIGARFHRDGDEAVATVVVGRCFEGPPGRVHGGVISAIFDEAMGSVFRATGTASAFTGELTVRFEGPAPTETGLEFRAREVRRDGRKRFLTAEGSSAQGRFATATATFIDMRPDHLRDSVL